MYTIYDPATASNTIKDTLVKEDVWPIISNLYPQEFAFLNSIGTISAGNNVFREYPIDTMNLVNRNFGTAFAASDMSTSTLATLARPEGFTPTDNDPFYKGRLKSVCEIQLLSQTVSGTSEWVNRYGVGDARMEQAMRLMEAIAQNIEFSAMWSTGTGPGGTDLNTAGSGNQTVRQTMGLAYWILKTGLNRSKGLGSASPGSGTTDNTFLDGHGNDFGDTTGQPALNQGAMTWAYDANGTTITREMFLENCMAKWWTLANKPSTVRCLLSPGIKTRLTSFNQTQSGAIVNERSISAADRTLNDGIDYYHTDFGEVGFAMTRHLSQATTVSVTHNLAGSTTTVAVNECAFLYNPEGFKRMVGRPAQLVDHGVGGDWKRFHVVYEGGVACMNPQHGTALVNCLPT